MLLYISFYCVKSWRSFENLELRSLCFLCQASVKFASTTLCSLGHSSTKDVKPVSERFAAVSVLYSRFAGNSTKFEIGIAVETVKNIATHQAVGRVQLLFMAPGKKKTFILWLVGWAGSCFEYIGIKTRFVVKRKKLKNPNQTGNILRNCYKTTTRKTSCLYLNREKSPDTSLAQEDIRHARSRGRLSKLKWPVGWGQCWAAGMPPAHLGKEASREQHMLPLKGWISGGGQTGLLLVWFVPAFWAHQRKALWITPLLTDCPQVRAVTRAVTQGTCHIFPIRSSSSFARLLPAASTYWDQPVCQEQLIGLSTYAPSRSLCLNWPPAEGGMQSWEVPHHQKMRHFYSV